LSLRVNYLTHIVRGGLCVLFELKKMVDEASVYQAVCELVVASILSTQWKPVVVLTDLMEYWQLFWLNGATVKHVRCPLELQQWWSSRVVWTKLRLQHQAKGCQCGN
jgi:hypothetical protein